MTVDFAPRSEMAIGTLPEDWAHAIGAVGVAALPRIVEFVADERDTRDVLPAADLVFAALRATPLRSVRAVILGQDPYPTKTHATGLAFSVPRDLPPPLPRSLMRIRAELEADGGWDVPDHGSLEAWTGKGVLLLNTALTVQAGHPGTHQRAGWTDVTDAIISAVAAKDEPVAFLLWGRHAQAKVPLITARHHVIVCSPHPMARSRDGFRGTRPFGRANVGLSLHGVDPIVWDLTG